MIFFFFLCFFTTFVICFILLTHVSETIELDLVNLSSNENSSIVVKSTPIINLNSSSLVSSNSGSGSPNLTNLTHLSQPTKKESNLRSWFNLSSSSSNAAGAANQSSLTQVPNSSLDISTTSTYQQQQQDINSTMLTDNNGTSDANASPQPSMQSSKSSKTNFGEIFNNKQNKFKEHRSTSPPLQSPTIMTMTNTGGSETPNITMGTKTNAIAEQNSKEQQPQKSSRRTTSLLNLFMSNSQGNSHNLSLFKTFNMILFFVG